MLKRILVSVFVVAAFLPLGLNASKMLPQMEVVKFVNENISRTADQLNGQAFEGSEDSGWEMQRVFIRIQGIIGIGLQMFTSFQVVPEVEFVMQKVRR
jgi:hypothetical protein